jgi:hypothetical protein
LSRETVIAVAVSALVVGTMAIDHLVGTESEPGETGLADPGAFVLSVVLALVLVAVFSAASSGGRCGTRQRSPR